ncbi:uncharacterized protein Fot_25206 [Forsythia ovata]|uniref:Uncharacterized protein n=1 Tax=Forsythia ovata TaxID=205694 RepID=A0ABD1U9I5_9LAMI
MSSIWVLSFKNADSIGRVAVAQLFPCTQEPPFLDPFSLKPIREKSIRTWPKADTTFHLWHARMMKHSATKAIFDRAKIFDLLEIATRPPLYDPVLFPIALSFWTSEYNTFIFPLGPMSITLRDVGALVNLPPLDNTISPAILISFVAPKFDKKYTDSYSGMQELYNNSGNEPSHAERVAFLQRDNIGIGGNWSEFVDYITASIKSEDVKLIVEGQSKSGGASHAKLIAQKGKGMPRISISLAKLLDGAASQAMAKLSLELHREFKNVHKSLVEVFDVFCVSYISLNCLL